jgi:glutamate/tyrosine decarboxylase-like PLP-dependent enzyme
MMSQDVLPRRGVAPIEMSADEFRSLGHSLVDRIADFLAGLPDRPVAPNEAPTAVRAALGGDGLPETGTDPGALLEEAATLLFDHSLFNGHPRFWGYITSSAAPIGALADLLAAAVNPNVGGWPLAPIATEIEAQTVRWLAELLGYPTSCGGLLVSGGNMANFVGVLAARRSRLDGEHLIGATNGGRQPRLYASSETHTWIQKAADLFGFGTDAVRWVETDARQRMKVDDLRSRIRADAAEGDRPFLVVGTAGAVATGAIDPLPALADVCREEGLWFHVDGAYGAAAAALPDAPADLKGLREADSIAFDPHKWLYAPLEAGCALVRDPGDLVRTFSHHPTYYPDPTEEPPINYYEYGLQNSRGFRALKVWLGLRQAGRAGYVQMINDDISLARELFARIKATPELEAFTNELSITTFRYVPPDLRPVAAQVIEYLNQLNRALLARIQESGEAYLSNAVVDGAFLLRTCIVNFRTTEADIAALPELVVRLGAAVDAELRPGQRPAAE